MITEIARIKVKTGCEEAFEKGVEAALPLFRDAENCHGIGLHRVIENTGEYVLLVSWNTVEDHMVTFRNSESFEKWRALVGAHFASVPEMHHLRTVVEESWSARS